MDLFNSFNVDNALYFTVQLIIAVAALGLFIFAILVGRQVQLMNRVLTTKLAGVFQFISLFFILGSGAVLLLTILALFA
jgi:hypothetical protein